MAKVRDETIKTRNKKMKENKRVKKKIIYHRSKLNSYYRIYK